MPAIYVDSDACPVKSEVIKVAKRYGIAVTFVANSWMNIPESWGAKLEVVEGKFDAADDWIVERIVKNDIVVSSDIPLIHRCIQKGSRALNAYGKLFTEQNIGEIISTRDLMTVLRGSGDVKGGPAPFQKEDRSRFLQTLDTIIQDTKKGRS